MTNINFILNDSLKRFLDRYRKGVNMSEKSSAIRSFLRNKSVSSITAGLMIACGINTSAYAERWVITPSSDNANDQAPVLRQLADMPFKRSLLDNKRWVIDTQGDSRAKAALNRIRTLKNVTVEPDVWVTTQMVPNDELYSQQWAHFEDAGGMDLQSAHDLSTGSGVVIGVVDTGYTDHPDLDANRLPGYDMISDSDTARDGNGRDSDARDEGDYTTFWDCVITSDSSWHGSHVAGIANAVTDNGIGIAGVAPNAKHQHIRSLGACCGYLTDIADAVLWASGGSVNGASVNSTPSSVINLSLGGGGACGSYMQDAVNTAVSRGSIVVVAAGNSNADAANATPANCNNVITVASTGRDGGKASYSNFGDVVDIAAPGGGNGGGILSTINSGDQTAEAPIYAEYQGTSMATPQVAGVIALLKSIDPNLTHSQVEALITETARDFSAPCDGCGSGIVDPTAALTVLLGGDIVIPDPDDGNNGGGSEPDPVVLTTYGGPLSISLNDARRIWWIFTGIGTTTTNLSVPSAGQDVNSAITIRHPAVSELSVSIELANGQSVAMNLVSSSGDNHTFQAMLGDQPAGSYKVTIQDNKIGNSGTLTSFIVNQYQ